MCVHCTRMEGKHTNGVLKVKIAITLRDCCAFSLLHLLFSRSLFINACEISLFAVAFLRSNVHVCVWVMFRDLDQISLFRLFTCLKSAKPFGCMCETE